MKKKIKLETLKKYKWFSWFKKNLFSTYFNTILTFALLFILTIFLFKFSRWLVFDAVFFAESREQCWQISSNGACWAAVIKRFKLLMFGFYPIESIWRLALTFILLIFALIPVLYDKTPHRKYFLWFSCAYYLIAFILIKGGFLGLQFIETSKLGGLLLSFIIGFTGITFSLPLGIFLALGRLSKLPLISFLSTSFIEIFRGVPLITLLFIASTMLNYLLPPGVHFDILLRVLIIVVIFSSSYMAEVVRGSLQGIPQGQVEAAKSLGLSYWQITIKITLPQALKISIPGIVGTFIGLFKDTTLVIVIGLLDILGNARSSLSDMKWSGLAYEFYIFIAFVFFVFCFSMSRYAAYLEKKLSTEKT